MPIGCRILMPSIPSQAAQRSTREKMSIYNWRVLIVWDDTEGWSAKGFDSKKYPTHCIVVAFVFIMTREHNNRRSKSIASIGIQTCTLQEGIFECLDPVHILAAWKWNARSLSVSSVFAMTVVSVVFLGTHYKTCMLDVASKPAEEVFLHFSAKLFDAIDRGNSIAKFEIDHFSA